jgi:hypothetical protein
MNRSLWKSASVHLATDLHRPRDYLGLRFGISGDDAAEIVRQRS